MLFIKVNQPVQRKNYLNNMQIFVRNRVDDVHLNEGIIEGKVCGRRADDNRMCVVGSFRETPNVAVVRVPGTEHLVGELEAGEASMILLCGRAGREKWEVAACGSENHEVTLEKAPVVSTVDVSPTLLWP